MKGVFYSIITAVLIIPIVLASYAYLNSIETRSDTLQVKALGDKLASFSASIDSDIFRATDIIARNSIQTSITYIDSSGKGLSNAKQNLTDLMRYGIFNGTASQNFTFNIWADEIRQKGESYGFTTNTTVLYLDVTQLDSYDVGVVVLINISLADSTGKMKLERLYNRTIPVPITDFVDPLYMLNTNGIIKRPITPADFVINNTQGLDNAVDKRFYMSSDGPTFLDRLEGKLARSVQYAPGTGIETIVYLPELQANGIQIKNTASSVDYLYFSSTSGCSVDGSSYSWLKLDSAHANNYSVTTTC